MFLTRTQHDAPPVMVWHLKHNRALHERLFVLTVVTESVPWINDATRLQCRRDRAPLLARHGPIRLHGAARHSGSAPDGHAGGCGIDLSDVTYYVGHETVVPRDDGKGLPRWVEALFAAMQRNSAHVSDYFKLPRDAVVEIGREIAI